MLWASTDSAWTQLTALKKCPNLKPRGPQNLPESKITPFMKRPYGVNLKRLGYRLLRIGIGCRLHWPLRMGQAKPFFHVEKLFPPISTPNIYAY